MEIVLGYILFREAEENKIYFFGDIVCNTTHLPHLQSIEVQEIPSELVSEMSIGTVEHIGQHSNIEVIITIIKNMTVRRKLMMSKKYPRFFIL